METNIPVDRRKTRRFRFRGGALAVFRPDPLQLGQIIDIGMGGLSVRFIKKSDRPNDYNSLSILLDFPDRAIEDIPIRTVAEFEVEETFRNDEKIYHRCLTFGDLTPEQCKAISRLICDYAGDEKDDRRWRHDRRKNDEPSMNVEDDIHETDRREVSDRRNNGMKPVR